MKPCAVLFVNPTPQPSAHPGYLRNLGFVVHEIDDWPDDDQKVRDDHVVIVLLHQASAAPMLAARMRAKPHFGRRLLVGLVPAETPLHARRDAEISGFDDVVSDACASRDLSAKLLRGLRARPELRCALPPPMNGRSAA